MRNLTETLLTAQKEASRTPYITLMAKNQTLGVVNLKWSRLYTGSESDYYHSLAIPSDGSLIRVRVTLPSDAKKLYRQRVVNPGPGSDFSQWAYLSQYDVTSVALAAQGNEVSLFFTRGDRSINWQKSSNSGASWGNPEIIDYSASTDTFGISAAYKTNGDVALFFTDQDKLYVKKYVGGSWQSKSLWNKTTGDLSGVAAVYDGDWNLLVTGKDTVGNYKLWSLIYGDGGDVPAGTWSDLKELASAPTDGNYEYRQAFLAQPDVYRTFFVEKFTDTEAYSRPFWSNTPPGAKFIDSFWREPVPFNLSTEYGLAIAHHGDYLWLTSPPGVWRAKLAEESLDLTKDVLSLKEELGQSEGRLVIELRNDDGRYGSPGEGEISTLNIGCELELSPGYITSQGAETSPGTSFQLEGFEHTSSGGKASLILYASDGWKQLKNWRARYQFRWNKSSTEMSVKDILAFLLGRCGLRLTVKSSSSVITSFYPDFTIQPESQGDSLLRKLLSFVPDVVFIEGNKAYLVNPQSTDSPVYAYGTSHVILEGSYRKSAWPLNSIQIEGYDPVGGTPIMVNSFAWAEMEGSYERLEQIQDRNLDSVEGAKARGDAFLRESEITSVNGAIRVPVNCGQQLYDVIEITDSRAGLNASKRRALGLSLAYNPRRGGYEHRLLLGGV